MMSELRFSLKKDTSRKTIHIDTDAFFVSVKERDHSGLVGRPLVIVRHPSDAGGRGVVTTANYIARQYGIHLVMSARKAYEPRSSATLKPDNYQKYSKVSQEVREASHRYTDMIEPVFIDEAYLDVTESKVNSRSATEIVKMIQYGIWRELQLICSAGASYNKLLIKLISGFQKSKGPMAVLPEGVEDFLKALPIEDSHGIGKKTVSKTHELGILTGTDLYKQGEIMLIRLFGKMGYSLYRKVRDTHDVPVQTTRDCKSVGEGHTYGIPLATEEQVMTQLKQLVAGVERAL